MPKARLCIEEQLDPALAIGRGRACWQACTPSTPVSLYGASLQGQTVVLGAYQQAHQALADAGSTGLPVLQRSTGGGSVLAGTGIVYVALGLYDRSALMSCPPLRILNRNVRGALQGLRLAGANAHYFGRDFLSVELRPAAYVAWQAAADGRVLVELFISDRSSCWLQAAQVGYPPRNEDPFRGKLPITLQEAGARVHDAALVESIAQGYASGFACEWQKQPLSPQELAQAEVTSAAQAQATQRDALTWSAVYEESIGFVSAGVALDGAGKLRDVQLAGDFFCDDAGAAGLRRALSGVTPSADMLGRALDAVYGRSGHELEGVRSLQTFQEAILDAVQRARAAGAAGATSAPSP